MIQDIYPHKLENRYIPVASAVDSSPVFCFDGRSLLIRQTEDGFELPTKSELGLTRTNFLFIVDKVAYFRPDAMSVINTPEGFEFKRISEVRRMSHKSGELIYAAFTALHLDKWYKDNRFCGRCGEKTEHSNTERALVCPNCGRVIYPRINPAVIVGITDGDRMVLTQYKGRKDIDFYALVAGFLEIGETFEECVAREVMEEVGLKVKNIRYYKSQPWGIADDILAGYFCDVDGDTTIRMDENELKVAKWMKREEIVLQPDNMSLTNEMMTIFKNGQKV